MSAEKTAAIEQKAAQWLKEQGYDRRTWKDLAPILSKFHQQQMQEKLEEAEKERAEECKICSCQPPYTRCYGFEDAINHLKETNKG